MDDITTTPEWAALAGHRADVDRTHLRELFAADPARGTELAARAGDLYLDYSKNLVTRDTLPLLFALARRADLKAKIGAMFAGERINVSENRPVLHVALRMPRGESVEVDGVNVVEDVHHTLDRMAAFADRVRSGEHSGHGGRRIRTVINIGIGGSDLGPVMAYQALAEYVHPELECRFVSNVDPVDMADALAGIEPAETLFIVSSKTFTTVETLTNARVARGWLVSKLGEQAVAEHFVGVSANVEKVAEFGIDPDLVFPMWDWVGGRYSYDSAIGLSLMIANGPDAFRSMLAGMHTIDEHFRTAPLEENLPVLQGLLGVWYRNFLGAQTHAVLPYSERLSRFPAYLQQLTMESTGKRVRLDGSPVTTDTGEIYWGEPGTNGQHAFYQLLHQGTSIVPADFIGFLEQSGDGEGDYDLFFANMLAQTAALAFGRTAEEVVAEGTPVDVVPHKVMAGNHPTSTIVAPRLTPSTLGQLVALYEHTVFVKGAIWGINCFDQWGVELGKVLARQIAPKLGAATPELDGLDSSTAALVRRYRGARGRTT
ncbi:MAG: glucose-6-phosphate isomerase [Kutzneria sp.]|nr:glucose-6-phosphate isomerase [Kutzneria sp.]MBV9846619.1 glucose-6-phosphate isomerase [Kutzneria sp.]